MISKYFDHIAIALSTVCIVHCLAVPVVVALLPVLALTWGLNDAQFHTVMLWFVVPTSVLGFAFGYHAHRGATIVLLGAVAIAVLALVALRGHGVLTVVEETVVNIAASVLLAVAHWRNFRAVRRAHSHHF
ncbi:MAG TPA: MerC domain-containing protein [Gammaproteobacteria bacterium]|nr:MerC domain-containing protein [Gammaproteobacteria bacterium]